MIRFATPRTLAPVAAQMAALDPDADLLTPEARQWLMAQARGSAERLRILMATAMFLAETEHAPHIDLNLAQRAGALQPDDLTETSVRPPYASPQRLKWGLALAAWSALSVASGMALDAALRAPHSQFPAPAPDTMVLASTSIAVPTVPAALPATGTPATSPGPAAPPPMGQVDAHSPAAPVAPPRSPVPVVTVRFFLASPGAAPRARFIEQRLAEAGFITRMVPDTRVPPPRAAAVVYFHREDEVIAQRAERTALLLATRPVFARAASQRRPVRGTIEFMLP